VENNGLISLWKGEEDFFLRNLLEKFPQKAIDVLYSEAERSII